MDRPTETVTHHTADTALGVLGVSFTDDNPGVGAQCVCRPRMIMSRITDDNPRPSISTPCDASNVDGSCVESQMFLAVPAVKDRPSDGRDSQRHARKFTLPCLPYMDQFFFPAPQCNTSNVMSLHMPVSNRSGPPKRGTALDQCMARLSTARCSRSPTGCATRPGPPTGSRSSLIRRLVETPSGKQGNSVRDLGVGNGHLTGLTDPGFVCFNQRQNDWNWQCAPTWR